MTLQMAIGRMIVEKIVGQPDKYPQEVVEKARNVIKNLSFWETEDAKLKPENWHRDDIMSWAVFKREAEAHNIDLPAILTEDTEQ